MSKYCVKCTVSYFSGGKKEYVSNCKRRKPDNHAHYLPGGFRSNYVFHDVETAEKRAEEMLSSMEVGDVVVTTSGFYGVLIDITDDDVIVEFGSNRNCRIPMKKSAIQEVEKQD